MDLRLLRAFRGLFEGQRYLHRVSNLGDSVAVELFEDLHRLGRARRFIDSVDRSERGTGPHNRPVSLERMRRGDGTFGLLIEPEKARRFGDGHVARGRLATIDVAVEVKILNKAMIKQIDRVVNDLEKQVRNWQRASDSPTTLAIIGINHADYTIGYEGDREYRTDGRANKHPCDEAPAAESHIVERVVAARIYDEVLILRYAATNDPPFPFSWLSQRSTEQAYRATLLRLSQRIDERLR